MVFHGVAAVAGVTVVNTSILAAREEMPPVVRPFFIEKSFCAWAVDEITDTT
jgi:hypothetical protein